MSPLRLKSTLLIYNSSANKTNKVNIIIVCFITLTSRYFVSLLSRRMRMFLVIFLSLSAVFAGPHDTVDQLKAAVSNVPYADQITRGEVTTVMGSVPPWLSGTAFIQSIF